MGLGLSEEMVVDYVMGRGASMTGREFEKAVICRVLPLGGAGASVSKASTRRVTSKRDVGILARLFGWLLSLTR
jgi:hypothetical protein